MYFHIVVVGCCSLVLFSVIGIAQVVCKQLVQQLYFCVVLLQFGAVNLVQFVYLMQFDVAWRSLVYFGVVWEELGVVQCKLSDYTTGSL